MIEDAIPINVSTGQTKSAREVFSINHSKLREKSELTKEEKRADRANKKRKIKTHLKKRADKKREQRRDMGMAQTDRFELKEMKRQMANKKAKEQKEGEKNGKVSTKYEMKSSKFFSKMQDVVKQDYDRKENKKRAKLDKSNFIGEKHNN